LLADGISQAQVKLPGGHSLSRNYFDQALITAAVSAGAIFEPGVTAKVLTQNPDCSEVQISGKNHSQILQGKITIVADGLSGHALDQIPGFEVSVADDARFGCGITFPSTSSFYEPARIYMACHRAGYVGLVRVEGGKIDIAAALDRTYIRENDGLAEGVANILRDCKMPLPVERSEFFESHWRGTDSLTRNRRKISAKRIFVIGDSCGYPEPLTGEGIAWALESAESVFPFALSGIDSWNDDLSARWQREYQTLVDQRKFKSRLIAYGLRNEHIRKSSIFVLSKFPTIGQLLAASLTKQNKQMVS
jgi:menaquinone-9 beta-reductase